MANYQVYKFISTKYEKKVEDMTNQAHAPRFSIVEHLVQFNPPQHVTASHPSPGDNHQSTEGQSERTHCHAKNAAFIGFLSHLHMHQGSPLLHKFRALSRSLHRHPSAAQGHLHAIHST